MKTSQTGIDLIKQFEGCVLTAYKCPAGVWTIGYGHTAGVKQGQRITAAQAESYLRSDLEKYEKKVDKYSRYGWNQNEFDALVSFAYNIGSIDQEQGGDSRKNAVLQRGRRRDTFRTGQAQAGGEAAVFEKLHRCNRQYRGRRYGRYHKSNRPVRQPGSRCYISAAAPYCAGI